MESANRGWVPGISIFMKSQTWEKFHHKLVTFWGCKWWRSEELFALSLLDRLEWMLRRRSRFSQNWSPYANEVITPLTDEQLAHTHAVQSSLLSSTIDGCNVSIIRTRKARCRCNGVWHLKKDRPRLHLNGAANLNWSIVRGEKVS